MILLATLASCALAPPLPAAPAPAPAAAQEDSGDAARGDAGQDPGQEPEKKPLPKKFTRLTSPQKKQVRQEIYLLVKEDEPAEERAAAEKRLAALGDGIVPEVIGDAHRFEEAGRTVHLWAVLDAALPEDALHLAWEERGRKTPQSVTHYLVRRWADSEREDATAFLRARLEAKEADAKVRYEAARGLAWRGHADVLPVIEREVREHWEDDAARLRADFAGFERGLFNAPVTDLMRAKKRADRLAGVRLFELFGVPEQAKLLYSFLDESDTTLRLGGINACRAVLAGEGPLEKPSMTQIIERAEEWKSKL